MSKDQTETIVDSLKKPTVTEKSDRQTETPQIQKTLAPENTRSIKIEPESSPALKKWADLIANDIENPDQSPTIKISRFGLKTSKDVLTFLRSPAGDSVMAEIGTQLAAEKSLHEYEQLQLREKQLLMSRLKAAFFLWYIEKKAHAADQQREIILEQNERAIKNSGHTAQPTTSLRPSSERTSLMRSISDYDRAIRAYQNRQAELENERKALDVKLGKLDAEMHMIEYKYDLYDRQLKDFDSTLEKLENAPTPEEVAEIQSQVDLIQAEMKEIEEKAAELTQLDRHDEAATLMKTHASLGLKRDNYLDVLSTEAGIQSQIDSIKTKMDQILDQVEELIRSNQDEEAAVLMKTHTSLNLNLARHFDMLAVREDKKHYVTEDGKTELDGKPVSFKDAHFILNKGQKIVKEGNEYYLLQPGQDLESLKDNPEALKEAKDKASHEFQQKKHELMVVENVVKNNKGLESAFTQEQITEVHTKRENIIGEETLIKNQTGVIQAARASAQNLLDNPNLGLSAPRPTITQGHSVPAPKPSFCPTVFYRNQLELEKFCSRPDARDVLMNMAKQAPQDNRQKAMNFLNAEYMKIVPSTGPIPPVMMQRMLQTLETFGVNTAKPSVTAIKKPLEMIKDTEMIKEAEESPSPSRLTPLSTNPFK